MFFSINFYKAPPRGTGEKSKGIFELQNLKAYKFIRYIRTKYKAGGDYAVWRWPDTDGGNRLNVKEIEIYTAQKPDIKNVEISGANVKVTLDNFFEAGSVLCVASYSGGALVGITSEIVREGISGYTVPLPDGANAVKAMLILDFDSLRPLCRCKSIEVIGE